MILWAAQKLGKVPKFVIILYNIYSIPEGYLLLLNLLRIFKNANNHKDYENSYILFNNLG